MDNDGRQLGVLMIRLDLGPLAELLAQRTGPEETGEVIVGRREGDRIRYLFRSRRDGRAAISRARSAAVSWMLVRSPGSASRSKSSRVPSSGPKMYFHRPTRTPYFWPLGRSDLNRMASRFPDRAPPIQPDQRSEDE